MSETVIVKAFGEGRDWSSEDGKISLTFFDTVFDRNGSPFKATWGKKQGTGEPTVGESVEGEFYEKKPGDWRFRKAAKPGGSTGSGGSYKKEWQPESQRDPEKTTRITRSHSQQMAVRVLTAMGSFDGKHGETIHNTLKSWIDWFEKDVNEAGKNAVQGAGANSASLPRAPAPEQRTADTKDLYELLGQAGLNPAACRVVTDYVDAEFSPQQRETAIHRLNDPNQQVGALNKLRELAEKHSGLPLPADPAPLDDLPF